MLSPLVGRLVGATYVLSLRILCRTQELDWFFTCPSYIENENEHTMFTLGARVVSELFYGPPPKPNWVIVDV